MTTMDDTRRKTGPFEAQSRSGRPMRIMLIEPGLNPIYVNFANELARRPFIEVHYVLPRWKGDSDMFSARVVRHPVPSLRALSRILHLPTTILLRFISARARRYYEQFPETPFYFMLGRLVRDISPDLIVANPLERPYAFQAARVAKKTGIPLLIQTEMQYSGQTRSDRLYIKAYVAAARRFILPGCAYFLPWTENSRRFWVRVAPELRGRIRTLPAGIPRELFSALRGGEQKKMMLGEDHGKRREKRKEDGGTEFLMVARFVSCKDHETVLEALRLLLQRKKRFRCTFIGEGLLKKGIRRKAEELGLAEHVRFGESVPYKKMAETYRRFDCLVLASRKEAIGMVVPEAMACGIPCIVPDNGGPLTYVDHGKTGLIFRTGDPVHLAAALEKMLRRPTCQRMGRMAARTIHDRFTWPRIVDRFLGLADRATKGES